MEIGAAISAVLFTSLIGLIVYQYRGLITYEVTSRGSRIDVQNSALVVCDAGYDAYFTTVTINNRGHTNIEHFEFFCDIVYDILGHKIESTLTIAKNTIEVEQKNKSITVKIKSLPRGEAVEILMIFPGNNSLWNAQGGSSKYRIRPQAFYNGMKWAGNTFKSLALGALVLILAWNVIKNG